MPGATVNCDLPLYADDTCIISQDSEEIEKHIETNFSIHLGEDKTKCIFLQVKIDKMKTN